LYSKRNGHCNVISGPSYPKYDSCQDSSVTTTTESAPSGIDTIELTWELESINLDLHLVLFSEYSIECEIYFNNPVCSDAVQVNLYQRLSFLHQLNRNNDNLITFLG
jgi:ABC-type metal ion transport system substrate-binding protein